MIPTGIEHGTVTVLWKGQGYEVTTLRGEGAYSDGRRPDEVFFVSDIEEDLGRRDFTVNAMAYDPLESRLVNPHGGMRDMGHGLVRAVGDPVERFREDGLRVLRAARFVATLDFALDLATEEAIPRTLDVFAKVSHERVRDEWLKSMKAKKPSRAFEVMRTSGILGVTFRELTLQHGCEQNRWHAFDVWSHTMHVLDSSEGDAIERLAALLHDVGKPKTRELSDKTGDYTFYNHEVVGAKMADRWLRDYRFGNDERERVVHLVRHHLVCYDPTWSDAAVRRFIRRVGRDAVEPLLELARADALGKGRPVDEELGRLEQLRERIARIFETGDALSTRDLAISGREVMERLDVSPGPIVGRVLRRLLEHVTEDPSLNQRERLLALVPDAAREAEGGA